MVKIEDTLLKEDILEAAPAFITVYHVTNGKYHYINDGFSKFLGYKKEVFFKKGTDFFCTLIHPQDFPKLVKESTAARKRADKQSHKKSRNSLIGSFEYRLKHADGKWRWVESNEAVIKRNKKGRAELMVGVSFDVTLRKDAELLIAESLREREEQYRIVFENTKDVILAIDMQGKILYASPANEKLLGYTLEESIGSYAFDIIHPDDRAYILKSFSEVSKNSNKIFVYRVRHKDGHYITVEGSGSVVYDNQRKPYMFVGIARDVTERIQLEKQKDTFIAMASHELKTPVTSLKAYAQVLQRHFTRIGDDQSARYLSRMNIQLDKLTHLINDLLDVTKVESGKFVFKKKQFDFNELILEVVDEMQLTTQEHTIVKKLQKSPKVLGDRDRIGQVIINLLSNAIKYSHKSGIINISTRIGKTQITTSVQDFGMGISAMHQKKIFERFYRVNDGKQENYPGLGLGLFISSEIVKRHEGKIKVKSKKGVGTTFSFSLPYETPLITR